MAVHRASCADCGWEETDDDLVALSDAMERHARKEVGHDVTLERVVATDSGEVPPDERAGKSHGGTVPSPLDELGQAFIPMDPGKKAPWVPRTGKFLHEPDDERFLAYLEAGHNYGVVTRGDLAVVDADDPERLVPLLDSLPETAWSMSGSRSGEHYFLFVPGLDADIPLVDPESGDNLGHVKAAAQSLVVGPGSRHPSGNYYGPLEGETIATVGEEDLRELVEPFRPAEAGRDRSSVSRSGRNTDLGIGVHDVVPRRRYPEGTRCEHPFHGSSTGSNFMVDEGGETWRCWRHDCTGNALHLIGIEQGVISCGDWTHTGLDPDTWRKIFEAAREAGYDLPDHRSDGDSADHRSVCIRCIPCIRHGNDLGACTR